MRYETSVPVSAPAERVWSFMSDIRGWPSWTPTVTAVDGPAPPLRLGQVHEVTQPGRGPTSYVVTELDAGRGFTWSCGDALVRQRAEHVVTPEGLACSVRLSFEMTGPVGTVLAALAGRKIRSFVDTEAASLRTRAEQPG